MMSAVETNAHYYNIADHIIRITFADSTINDTNLVPSLKHFELDEPAEPLLLSVYVDDNLAPMEADDAVEVGVFNEGNGDTIVKRKPDGSIYYYQIKYLLGNMCCQLKATNGFKQCYCALSGDANERGYGLNNALMMMFAFSSCGANTLMIHSSTVRHKDFAYAFIAKSGVGKSTQVSSWLRYIEDCDLINDDTPIIRIIDNEAYIYGSPWSGKTACYRRTKVKLGAIVKINRANENRIEQPSYLYAVAGVMPSVSSMRWEPTVFGNTCNTLGKLLTLSPFYNLYCLPDKEAALLCHDAIVRTEVKPL